MMKVMDRDMLMEIEMLGYQTGYHDGYTTGFSDGKIGVSKDLKFIYENLKPTIYNIVSKTTTAVLLNKLMINFKTL
jgi:hypothetical protein